MFVPWLATKGFGAIFEHVATALPALVGITFAVIDRMLEQALTDRLKSLLP